MRSFKTIRDDSSSAIVNLYLLFLVIHSAAFLIFGHVIRFIVPFVSHVTLAMLGAALVTATLQMLVSFYSGIERSLDSLGAAAPDPKDMFHTRFKNAVDEVALATPVGKIESYVLPFSAPNAFAMSDRKRSAIAITEGALGRLKRDELSAVVAHEAAHIVHGDTRAKTFAYLSIEIFETLRVLLWKVAQSGWIFAAAIGFVGAVVSAIAEFLMRLTSLAISRERETRADASAVEYTRDPLALAAALKKLDDCPGFLPKIATPLLIVPPHGDALEGVTGELAGWFSTHPPLETRIALLAGMARAKVPHASAPIAPTNAYATEGLTEPPDFGGLWWIFGKDGWLGPYLRENLIGHPSLTPEAWVAKDGDTAVLQASHVAWIRESLLEGSDAKGECPHCGVALSERLYEGATIRTCKLCAGNLVESEKIARFMTRTGAPISDELWARARKLMAAKVLSRPDDKTKSGYLCPDCGITMMSGLYNYQASIIVERCLRCGIIWFDRDELELIQAVQSLLAAPR